VTQTVAWRQRRCWLCWWWSFSNCSMLSSSLLQPQQAEEGGQGPNPPQLSVCVTAGQSQGLCVVSLKSSAQDRAGCQLCPGVGRLWGAFCVQEQHHHQPVR
jgi:hypothetical protein